MTKNAGHDLALFMGIVIRIRSSKKVLVSEKIDENAVTLLDVLSLLCMFAWQNHIVYVWKGNKGIWKPSENLSSEGDRKDGGIRFEKLQRNSLFCS